MAYLLACLAILCSAVAQGLKPVDGGSKSAADALFTMNNFSGVVAARQGSADNVLYKNTFGYLDWQFDVPMPFDAQFPIASNSKLYVAISLYQLQEKGLVDLEKNVADYIDQQDFWKMGIQNKTKYCPYLPESPTVCQNQTFVQLMEMSGGIQNQGLQFLPWPGSVALVVGRYIERPLLFKPGTQYYYSNPSFMLGAYMVQKFSGLTFGDYIQKHIVKPLGLKNTYFDPQDEMFHVDSKRINEFHRFIDPITKESVSVGKCTEELNTGSANGAGGIIGNVDDEAKLYFSVFNFSKAGANPVNPYPSAGGGILQPQSVLSIVKARNYVPPPVPLPNGIPTYYAQGLFVNTDDSAKQLPNQIVYEGMLQCSWTANVYDLTKEPVMMGQAYTNTPVYYANKTFVEAAHTAQENWWQLTATLPQPQIAAVLALNLTDLIAAGGGGKK